MKLRWNMDRRFKITEMLSLTLIFLLAGSTVAQESFLPAPIPPSGGYMGQNQYAQPAAAYPTTATYPNQTSGYQTPSQATSSQTVGQQVPQYQATQQQVPQYQTPQYQTPQYQAPQQQYAQPTSQTETNPIQQTRYLQPSMPNPSSPFPQTAPHSASFPSYTPLPPDQAPATSNNIPSSGSIEGQTVVNIRVVGNKTVPKARIDAMLHTRQGRPYSRELIERDVRELSRSGLFVNVKPSYQETPGGPIVIFEVLERPMLDSIKFIVGDQAIRRKTLLKESGLKEGDAADPFKVEEARRSLEYFYHDKGFAQARVTVHKGNQPGDREVVFVINEGSKKKILWTQFEGNTIVNDAVLRTKVESKQGIMWFINGEFNREKIEADKEKLTAYYRGLGFFKARVGAEVTFPLENWSMVTFVIDEGPRYKVRETRFLGHEVYREGQLLKDLKLLSGEFFNQNKMNADIRAIQERYGRVGYVFADVKAEPRFLEEPGTLDLVYNIKEGDQYTVGELVINIKGDGETPRTKKSVVLDRLSLSPGDIIDTQKIRDSERRLRASSVFSANPATGSVPKIFFSPPEDPEETEDAYGAYGGPSASRGQNR